MRLALVLVLALIVPAAGCSKNCTAEARAGIVVRVPDAASHSAILTADVEAVDGTYLEHLVSNDDGTYAGAIEREGTYTVTVVAPGYTAMTVQPVQV